MLVLTTCPGCRVQLEPESNEPDELANASRACRELYNTLIYWEARDPKGPPSINR